MPVLNHFGLLSIPGVPLGAKVIPVAPLQASMSGIIVIALLHKFPFGASAPPLSATVKISILGFVFAFFWGALFNALWPEWALARLLMRVAPILGAGALLYVLNRTPARTGYWIVLAIILQPLIHLPTLVHALVTSGGDAAVNWNKGPAGYPNVRQWGMLVATGFVMVLGGLGAWMSPSRLVKLSGGICLTVLAGLLFFSGTRAGVIGVFLGVAGVWLLRPNGIGRTIWLASVALTAGLLLSLWFEPPSPNYGLFNSMTRWTEGVDGRDVTSGRLTLWIVGAQMVLDYPLFGHGLDQLILFNPPEFKQHHLHNTPLQLLFDFGLVGGIAVMLLLATVWRRAIVAGRDAHDPAKAAALGGLLTLVAMCPFEDILYHTDLLATTMLLTAVLLSRPLASPSAKR